MKKIFLCLGLIALTSCEREEYIPITQEQNLDTELSFLLEETSNGEGASYFILPESDDFSAIPQDPLNPLTAAKIKLGKMLLHDPATGGNPKNSNNTGQYSCASCHAAPSGFSSGKIQGIGEGGIGFGTHGEGRILDISMNMEEIDVQPLRSPNLLNLAYQDVMLWNGKFGGTGINKGTEAQWTGIPENTQGFSGIEVQAMQGQDVHRIKIDEQFVDTYGYRELFDNAFSDIPKDARYTRITGGLAMAAYERTLLANRAPWQEYLKGNQDAMTTSEKKGAQVFFSTGRCFECHSGPALKDKNFYGFGMGDFSTTNATLLIQQNVDMEANALGRGGFTKNPEDNYKFKTPTLYNLADNGIYGHGGSFTNLRELINYKVKGVPQNSKIPRSQLASQFGAIDLSQQEIDDLTAFIANGLRDPELERYEPEMLYSGMCYPNNDAASRRDLGCD